MQMSMEKYIEDTGSTWAKLTRTTPSVKYAVEKGLLIMEDNYVTLPFIKHMEQRIAIYAVIKNFAPCEQFDKKIIDIFIKLYEKQERISLDYWQKEAVHLALNHNLFILTGGPGTGKTCVLKCIEYCLRNVVKTDCILFTAPTGKAARRIKESVGANAMTVAKALGLTSEDALPRKITGIDVIIVDEVSMLDTKTCLALLESSMNSKLILVGDVEQLPSVGYGSILRDLIDAELPCVKLEKTFRQANESGLFANIEQIKAGLHTGFVKRDDFLVFEAENTNDAKNIMVKEYLKAVERYGVEQVVCLTPYRRKGEACAIKLNQILQDKINPKSCQNFVTFIMKEDGFQYEVELREGDPVMQLVNATKVANGDVGVITSIDTDMQTIKVKFIDAVVTYHAEELGQLTLAYAMSVHKAQGSEYACVITSALKADSDMLSRNTIYTAVTRAKKECIMVTQGNIATLACQKEIGYERITRLVEEVKKQAVRLDLTAKLCL